MRFSVYILMGLLLLAGKAVAEPSLLEHLTVFLTGNFSNADQARGDQNFREATLHIAPIWSERSDGPWLYGEQALAEASKHPYRQFIYQLAVRPDAALEVRIYDLPNPIAATGAWEEPSRVANLTPNALTAREGCNLILRLQPNGAFKGGTEGPGCASSLRGATYSTVETSIDSQRLISWERGYNASGTQVRGSIHGGYIFKKVE